MVSGFSNQEANETDNEKLKHYCNNLQSQITRMRCGAFLGLVLILLFAYLDKTYRDEQIKFNQQVNEAFGIQSEINDLHKQRFDIIKEHLIK